MSVVLVIPFVMRLGCGGGPRCRQEADVIQKNLNLIRKKQKCCHSRKIQKKKELEPKEHKTKQGKNTNKL